MDNIILTFAEFIDKVGQALNLNSTAGAIALGIGIILIGIGLICFIWRVGKKVIGKTLSVILIIAILIGCGILTLGQVRNFLEASGSIVSEGWSTATEEEGSSFIYWIKDLINDEDSEVGGFDFSQDGTW
jgi:hypothetical protein